MFFSFIWALAAFLIAINLLIAVHEFGHFIVARFFKVKVLRFSIGFGKTLFHFYDKRGTEYVLAAIPIGGYVKMLDENEGEVAKSDFPLAFNKKSVWQRIAIICAGPIFNILFAFLVYWLVFMIGITGMKPIIGAIIPGSIASKSHLQPLDQITSINHQSVQTWDEVNFKLVGLMGKPITLEMTTQALTKTTLSNHLLEITNWQVDPLQPQPILSLGILPYQSSGPVVVGNVLMSSPAQAAGIQAGDKIIRVNNIQVNDWNSLRSILMNSTQMNNAIVLLQRGKKLITVKVQPKIIHVDGVAIAYLGIESMKGQIPKQFLTTKQYPWWLAWQPALKKTSQMTLLTFALLGKMVTGAVSLKSISGPIGIAQGAGLSANIGLSQYLDFIALISISLGVINILPIPVLDGGHLLYCLIELVRGKPVSQKTRELGLRLGIAILLCLIILAFVNDFSRILS